MRPQSCFIHGRPRLFVVYSQNSVSMHSVCENPLKISETTEKWNIGTITRGVVSSEDAGVNHERFALSILYIPGFS